MKTELLNRTHPRVDLDVLAKYKALFEGGETFKKMHPVLAPPLPGESPEHYAFRRSRLRYRGYVGPIIWFFVEVLFQAPFTVRLSKDGEEIVDDPLLKRLMEDADGKGKSLASIAQSAFLQMSRDGWAWLHLEQEDKSDGIETKLETECAAEVINWQSQGDQIAWLIERDTMRFQASPYDEKALCVTTWSVYDPSNKTVWRAIHPEGEELPKEAQQISSEPHGFLQVPFVALMPEHGLFLMGELADTQLEIFGLSNAHSWSLNVSAYPTAVFTRAKDGHNPVIAPGGLTEIKVGEDLKWIAPPSAPFEALAEKEKKCIEEMYRVAHQLAHGVDNSAAAVGRSGESKAADNEAMQAALRGFGRLVCEGIESILQIAIDASRDDGAVVSVEGLKDFDADAIGRQLESLKRAMDAGIDSPAFLAELRKQIARALLRGAEKGLLETIEKEIDAPPKATSAPIQAAPLPFSQ